MSARRCHLSHTRPLPEAMSQSSGVPQRKFDGVIGGTTLAPGFRSFLKDTKNMQAISRVIAFILDVSEFGKIDL